MGVRPETGVPGLKIKLEMISGATLRLGRYSEAKMNKTRVALAGQSLTWPARGK